MEKIHYHNGQPDRNDDRIIFAAMKSTWIYGK